MRLQDLRLGRLLRGRCLPALALAGLLAGCSSESLVRPGRYGYYNCEQIAMTGKERASREAELKGLMQKASQGPGGELAIALAYRTEYITVQGELKELESAAATKKCNTPWRPISEQVVR
jgi:hypothetical protein